jgi:hypothetical protein
MLMIILKKKEYIIYQRKILLNSYRIKNSVDYGKRVLLLLMNMIGCFLMEVYKTC